LRRTKYRDFNDAHFTEKLAEEQPPLRISVRTVRRVLRAGGVPAVRRRRPPKHRRRRDRKAQAGLMLLWDGSRHDWLEGRGRWQSPTQSGQALAALAIEAIYARSPEAKGRVERLWGTLQDRLVSELRLAGARTSAEANAVLERYRPVHNRRFAIPPQDTTPAW